MKQKHDNFLLKITRYTVAHNGDCWFQQKNQHCCHFTFIRCCWCPNMGTGMQTVHHHGNQPEAPPTSQEWPIVLFAVHLIINQYINLTPPHRTNLLTPGRHCPLSHLLLPPLSQAPPTVPYLTPPSSHVHVAVPIQTRTILWQAKGDNIMKHNIFMVKIWLLQIHKFIWARANSFLAWAIRCEHEEINC